MTYQETLDYLYAHLPMFTRIGAAAIKKDLTNTILLCEKAGNPQNNFKTIHIAGTNGKGSTSHMLAAVFQAAGYKTGLYTSPHLQDFRERIRINGSMIPEQEVVRFVEKHLPAFDEIQPSFFEATVLMAFEYFASEKVDIAIIETGLGGRLDSTNIITPELSLITNIGLDHVHLLGDTLPLIAAEKAGIIKPGIPVIIGETHAETRVVFEDKARLEKAPLIFADQLRTIAAAEPESNLLKVVYTNHQTQKTEAWQTDLPGLYQRKNLCGVLAAIDVLRQKGWNITDAAVASGITSVKSTTGLMGRWEVLRQSPLVVFDVGHNEDGVRQIIAQLARTTYTTLRVVIGMVKDKDIDKVLSILPNAAVYYFTQADIPRALAADELKAKAAASGLTGDAYPNVKAAVRAAYSATGPSEMLLVCGSVFVVGEVDRSLFN